MENKDVGCQNAFLAKPAKPGTDLEGPGDSEPSPQPGSHQSKAWGQGPRSFAPVILWTWCVQWRSDFRFPASFQLCHSRTWDSKSKYQPHNRFKGGKKPEECLRNYDTTDVQHIKLGSKAALCCLPQMSQNNSGNFRQMKTFSYMAHHVSAHSKTIVPLLQIWVHYMRAEKHS